MTLTIGERSVVSMHYKLTDDKGTVIDTSEGSKPLAYLHGAGNIIPGLEKALVGKTEGESLRVRIEPSEGYGDVNPDLIKIIERKAFEGIEKLEAGMTFQAKAPDGSTQNIMVTKVDGDDVTIDSNHPLAGITLNFDIQILSVREATKEELDHGHTHEGGHSH
ncbi:MAG: peptidylprolyl isomerase [Nitrospirales bacterium]|nr:peptidylprolyl isomerase [Nitrospira sp.]MDR4500454.1 peptidylprolyl isomerase [Nitrospirales bacterium]